MNHPAEQTIRMLVFGALAEGVELVGVAIGYSNEHGESGCFTATIKFRGHGDMRVDALPDEWVRSMSARIRRELGASSDALLLSFVTQFTKYLSPDGPEDVHRG